MMRPSTPAGRESASVEIRPSQAQSFASSVSIPHTHSRERFTDTRTVEEDADDFYDNAKGRRTKKVWKTVTAAILLFVIGSLMLTFGVKALNSDHDRGVAMCVVGSLAFIPGVYACFLLLGACLRWPGYDYDSLPSYDDD